MNNKKVGISIFIVVLVAIVGSVVFYFLQNGDKETFYKVTFDFNNNNVTEVVEVKANDQVVKPVDPVKENYTFEGWYYNGTKFDFTTLITKDITLVARWTEASATKWVITFDTAGGKYIENLNVVDGEKIEEVPTPEKDGYKFIGWYYNNEKFDFETKITKNMILVAKWEKVKTDEVIVKKYTVKFDADNGSNISSKTVDSGKAVSKPSDPTKEGYIFTGWYNGDKLFDFKTAITKDITLKAKWKKIETPEEPKTKYTVTFDANGGSTVGSEKVEEGKTATKPNDPIKEGYTFVGWYHNEAQFNFSTLITSNITLTAKWEKNAVITYKIEEIPESYVGQVKIFVLKDGIKVDGIVDITTTSDKVVTKEISKDGYVTNGAIIKSISNVRVK